MTDSDAALTAVGLVERLHVSRLMTPRLSFLGAAGVTALYTRLGSEHRLSHEECVASGCRGAITRRFARRSRPNCARYPEGEYPDSRYEVCRASTRIAATVSVSRPCGTEPRLMATLNSEPSLHLTSSPCPLSIVRSRRSSVKRMRWPM